MQSPKPRSGKAAPAGHPIAVVAERTGLSRDVLRVWERRYAAVEPIRSPGGQRLYSNEQIDRFRLLAAATKHGRNISLVAPLSDEALRRLVAEDEAERPALPPATDGSAHADRADLALQHTRALDGSALDRELRRAIAHDGLTAFLEEIVPTLMYRVGEEWEAGRLSVAHEHLASAAALAIILEAMHSVPEVPGAPRLLVATPSGERHVVGAALGAATAALDGWTVTYLGAEVPAADLVAAAAASSADAVALSVVQSGDPEAILRELMAVRASLPASVPLIVGGAGARKIAGQLTELGLIVSEHLGDLRRVVPRTT